MDNKDLALLAAKLLDSKKAKDISIIDIAEKSGFADYFVIATAGSARQISALCDEVEDGSRCLQGRERLERLQSCRRQDPGPCLELP